MFAALLKRRKDTLACHEQGPETSKEVSPTNQVLDCLVLQRSDMEEGKTNTREVLTQEKNSLEDAAEGIPKVAIKQVHKREDAAVNKKSKKRRIDSNCDEDLNKWTDTVKKAERSQENRKAGRATSFRTAGFSEEAMERREEEEEEEDSFKIDCRFG